MDVMNYASAFWIPFVVNSNGSTMSFSSDSVWGVAKLWGRLGVADPQTLEAGLLTILAQG